MNKGLEQCDKCDYFISVEEAYKQGAREFAEWLCQKSDIAYVNYVDFVTAVEDSKSIDEVLAEWEKEVNNAE